MGVIIPSILVRTKREVEEKLARIKGYTDVVQLDVVDGVFASPATWPYVEEDMATFEREKKDIHDMGDFRFEIDLMVADPVRVMGAFLGAGAAKLVVHVESTSRVGELIDQLEQTYGRDKEFSSELLSLGLSIQLDTDLSVLAPHIARIDYVQFMGIATIGRQGALFDSRVVAKIREFKKIYPTVPVQVDGGVSLTTAPELLAAGAERLVVGSALWHASDIEETLHAFEELANEYGRYQ